MPERCPTCEHELEGILDFPRVLVVQFNRTKFPDLIGSNFGDFYEDNPEDIKRLKEFTSSELAEKLKNSSGEKIPFKSFIFYKDQNDGKTGYWCLANITDSVNRILQLPQVEGYLKGLEESVGKEILRDKILIPNIKDAKLNLYLQKRGDNEYAVNLFGDYMDCFHGSHEVALVNKDIATIKYEGRLNN
jgi:hypothetical protein